MKNMLKKLILLTLLFSLFLAKPDDASAHAADMYFLNHQITLDARHIQVEWEIVSGPIIAQSVWNTVDANQDTIISDQEAQSWAESISGNLDLSLNGESLALSFQSVQWPSDVNDLMTGDQPIRISLSADWDLLPDQANQLTLSNRFLPQRQHQLVHNHQHRPNPVLNPRPESRPDRT